MRSVSIIMMDKEDYNNLYGKYYSDGSLFDYPLDELDYIISDTEINNLALIENRLYELPY